MHMGISFDTLIRYTDNETQRWRTWFAGQPAAILDEPFGIGQLDSLRGLLVHIFGAEMRFAQRLMGEPVSTYESFESGSLEKIFALHDAARTKLKQYLVRTTEADMARQQTFQTLTAGTCTASNHKIVANALLHGIRHWAQIATVLRERGYATPGTHDLLLSDVIP